MECPLLSLFPWAPVDDTLMRRVVWVVRSRTKTSSVPFVSPGTRFDAEESNATNRPSAEMEILEIPKTPLSSFPWAPVEDTLTRFVSAVVAEADVATSSVTITAAALPTDPRLAQCSLAGPRILPPFPAVAVA
jgi:hypothetical protein